MKFAAQEAYLLECSKYKLFASIITPPVFPLDPSLIYLHMINVTACLNILLREGLLINFYYLFNRNVHALYSLIFAQRYVFGIRCLN